MNGAPPVQPAPAGPGDKVTPARRADTLTRMLDQYARVATVPPADRPVPATPAWTVRDVTAHLVTAADRYLDGPRDGMARTDDPEALPRLNETLLRRMAPTTHPDLLDRLRARVAELLAQVDGYGDAPPTYLFNAGQPVRADRALGILAGELAVHGGDIAAAAGQAWPVTAADVDVVLDGLEQVLPGWLNPRRCRNHTAAYDIRLRGGAAHAWTFTSGALQIEPPSSGRFDCHLSGRPATLLRVMYRRQPPLSAAATGNVVAWGRRPWLALSLADRFHRP